MQTLYPDAYNRFKSLDDIYYYGGQNAHNVIASLDHKPGPNSHEQIQMKTGDLIGIGKVLLFTRILMLLIYSFITAGNHWDGYSKGKNLRTLVSKNFYFYIFLFRHAKVMK